MKIPPEDAHVDVMREARQLLDDWCERRAYGAICTMYRGMLHLNGLSDGWELFLNALKQLRILAKAEKSLITAAEAEKVQLLIGVVSRALNWE